MKLVAQKVLFYQQGSSDKVYEIDLCEVGPGQFVVNYRYGRRGARLRDGTETPAPLQQRDAQRAFDKLVASKVAKGYAELQGAQPAAQAQAAPALQAQAQPPRAAAANPVTVAVLAALQRGLLHRPPPPGPRRKQQTPAQRRSQRNNLRAVQQQPLRHHWPLDRAIWRAGELGLAEAKPLLAQLLASTQATEPAAQLRLYGIVWALGRCARLRDAGAAQDERVVSLLRDLCRNDRLPQPVRRIAAEALRSCSDDAARTTRRDELLRGLPTELSGFVRTGTPEAVTKALRKYLAAAPARHEVLEALYLIDGENVRPGLLAALAAAPLRPPVFQHLRHLYKAAEYRRDGEVFGLLAYRFEKVRAYCRRRTDYYGKQELQIEGRPLERHSDVSGFFRGPGATAAFSGGTRAYLRRRTWRTLRGLGQAGDPAYVNLAVGVLLPFTDADAVPVKGRCDAFAPYWAFNYILYGQGRRYVPHRNGRTWRCAGTYRLGAAPPASREESFPQLWERRPAGLLHLLAESACLEVHRFATRTLRACPKLLHELDTDTIVMLLGRPYDVTAALGFELAGARHRPEAPDLPLVLAVASCSLAQARATAQRWIGERRELYLQSSEFLLGLCTAPHADTRCFARDLLRATTLQQDRAQALIGRLVAYLLALPADQPSAELARDIAETLLLGFPVGNPLRSIGMRVVLDLLGHPLKEVQELGGDVLLRHERGAADLPEEVLLRLLDSPHESVRGIGVRLFAQLDDAALLKREGLVTELLLHRLPDLRHATRQVLKRLLQADPGYAGRLAEHLVAVLLRPEPATHERLHADVVTVLTTDLLEAAAALPLGAALGLCAAPTSPAQELGGQLLLLHPQWAHELDTAAIVRLGNHEVLAVRTASWRLFGEILDRLRGSAAELAQGTRLLDATPEDTRQEAERIFETAFGAEHWTPKLLVGVCDSARPQVQALGRRLITRFFEEAHGHEYLLKLSEHPSGELQLFATNYLGRYAAGDIDRLRALVPYFLRVLCRPNQGRVARRRVLEFLEAEALKGEAPARLVAEDILGRHSATMAIGDRARALSALLRIKRAFPQVAVPITVKEPALRPGHKVRPAAKEARGGV